MVHFEVELTVELHQLYLNPVHFPEYSRPLGCDMVDEEGPETSYKMTGEQGQEQDASEVASLIMPMPANAGAGGYDAVAWALDRFL